MSVDHVLIVDPDQQPDTVFHHILTRRSDRLFVPRGWPLPTNANPGTPEKIAILSARLESGAELHHPDDMELVPGGDVDALRRAGYSIDDFKSNRSRGREDVLITQHLTLEGELQQPAR